MVERSPGGWTLAGYQVEELVGVGVHGQVWRGRELATGDLVALRRVPAAADPGARDRLRRAAAAISALDHPHLVVLRRVAGSADGAVLVLDFAAGGSLASLLAERGQLTPGEVVTTAAPLAGAFAAVHARGLVHGAVSLDNVLYTSEGRPLLADLGLAALLAPDAPAGSAADAPTPADDVLALATLCRQLLGDCAAVPPALGAAIDAGLAPAADRASAAALATLLSGSCRPEPVRLARVHPAAIVAPPAAPHPRTPQPASAPAAGRRPRGLVLALPVLLVVAVVAGWAWAHAEGPPAAGRLAVSAAPSGGPAGPARTAPYAGPSAVPSATPTSSARPSAGEAATGPAAPSEVAVAPVPAPTATMQTPAPSTDWASVLRSLSARRDAAFVAADPAGLAGVYTPGATPYAPELAALRQLVAAGLHARGLHHELSTVTVTAATPDRVALQAVDELAPYDVLDATGAVVAHRPGRGPRPVTVVLGRVGSPWRIATLAPAGPAAQ